MHRTSYTWDSISLFPIFEYLEMRFGKVTRLTASVAYLLQTVLYMGVAVYAPALALQAVTNLDKTVSILVIGSICTFYSTIGGMKAVLMTDVFQVNKNDDKHCYC